MNPVEFSILKVMDEVKQLDIDKVDPRVRAIVLTKLEEAQLWASKIFKS